MFKAGTKVKWIGPKGERYGAKGERGVGVVIYETWENGCYVRWQDDYEEPCRHANLEAT
jgi:hypothetical protein